MHIIMKSGIIFVLLLAGAAGGFCGERIKIKGYYQEDGTYIKPRVIDPIRNESDVLPSLSNKRRWRKKQICQYYEGRVFTAKVSFPASHKGIILYGDDLGKTNVDLFRKINKYGASIDKGEKVIITKFDIGRRVIDIELNNGGYGDLGDMSWRALKAILTLGLTELKDYSRIRYQQGSRLRIKLGKKGSYNIYAGDLDVDRFKDTLRNESETNRLILEILGMEKDQLPSLTEEKLVKALDLVLMIPDFQEKIDVSKLDLPKKINWLLVKAMKASSAGKHLKEKKVRTLNKGLLCALYPREIQKHLKKFTTENLNFETINEYASLVLE